MDITFSCIRSKEIVNIYDGKRLGHITDLVFDKHSGRVLGLIVPEPKKMFKKAEDIFIPLELLKKIGDDVILVRLEPREEHYQTTKNDKVKQNETKSVYKYQVGCDCEERGSVAKLERETINMGKEADYSNSQRQEKSYARYKRVPKKVP